MNPCAHCEGRCSECGAPLPGDDFCENGHDVEFDRDNCPNREEW